MKADVQPIIKLIRNVDQFKVPIYQRHYSWREKDCRQLWQDIMRAGATADGLHFVGAIVCIDDGERTVTEERVLIIDGQQRITTIMLLLEAIARSIENDKDFDGIDPDEIRKKCLVNEGQEEDRKYKMTLSRSDRDYFMALMDGREDGQGTGRLKENFIWLSRRIAELSPEAIITFHRGINNLQAVSITLDREKDDPQLIFESMNSTGKELDAVDLIRNYMLMDLPGQTQDDFYKSYWKKLEERLVSEDGNQKIFETFIHHYLTVVTGKAAPKTGRPLYQAFKDHQQNEDGDEELEKEELLQDMRKYAGYYANFACGEEHDGELAEAFDNLCLLDISVSASLMLALYADYDAKILARNDFLKSITLLESYIMRRWSRSDPTNVRHNKLLRMTNMVHNDDEAFDKAAHAASFERHIKASDLAPFPSDEEFVDSLREKEVYGSSKGGGRCRYLLIKLEDHRRRKERVERRNLTIEHIMPQDLTDRQWKEDLGDDWKAIHQTYKDTLGNLTLVGPNSEYGSKPFLAKRNGTEKYIGYKDSNVGITRMLGEVSVWNKDAIEQRSEELLERALKVWPSSVTKG